MNEQEFLLLCKQVISKIKNIPEANVNISIDDTFRAYGLDSLDIMNFFLELEDRLGMALAEVDPVEFNSFKRVYTLIDGQSNN